MAAVNDVTGDSLVSKTNSDAYRNNYDAIFGKKKKEKEVELEPDTNAGGADSSNREK